MDDQNMNNSQQPVSPPVAQAMPSASSTPTMAVQMDYAPFMSRMIAFVIDQVVIAFTVGLLATAIGMVGAGMTSGGLADSVSMLVNLLGFVAQMVYYVGLTHKKGATLGKMAVGIRVQRQSDGQNLTLVEAFLREVVGKFVSGIPLGLGYFWMLWDQNKQTWHDKIAKSVVVKAK